MSQNEQKYRIKEAWRFNLESMNDKLWCLEYDYQDGQLQLPIEVAGTIIKDEDDFAALREECIELLDAACYRKVTGKEFGRIKQIVEWRVNARYMRCIASGMSDRDAGMCFEDI